MPQVSRKDFEIAIVGGGVCGLACAIALAKEGISTHVYEAASKFGEIGAGIGIGPNAVNMLREIGVLDDILAAVDDSGRPNRSAWIRLMSGQEDAGVIYDYPFGPGEEGIGMHRASFLDVLVSHLDPDLIHCHMNKRCIGVTRSEAEHPRATIRFADGTQTSVDIVLGADGIKSAVRGAVSGQDSQKHVAFSDSVCYRGLFPTDELRASGVKTDLTQRPVCFVGKDKHVLTFSIKGGRIINVVAFVTDRRNVDCRANVGDVGSDRPAVSPATVEELLSEFEDWGSDVHGILTCIQKPTKWNIHVLYPPLESYAKGNIALLGDAAHAMLPHLGAGAGQGLEDALLLAKLISYPLTTVKNIEDVLSAYDIVRRPRASRVWEESLRAGEIYELVGKDQLDVQEMRKQMAGIADFIWHHRVEDDVQSAIDRLQVLGVFSTQDATA